MITAAKMTFINFWCDPKGRAKLGSLYKSPLFWIIFGLKLLAGVLFASDYMVQFFIPFLERFAQKPFSNPYSFFVEIGRPEVFPYPALMLDLLGGIRILSGLFIPEGTWGPLGLLFVYRLPLLLADIFIMSVLVRWLRNKTQSIIWLYWASPVLFYITYLHGQLDVIPLAFLFGALYFLFKEHIIFSAIALGLGLACKTHLIVALPFFILYIFRRYRQMKKAYIFTATVFIAFLFPNIPYINAPSFLSMVFLNFAQRKLFSTFWSVSGDSKYYLVLGAYLLLLFKALQISVQNRDLFLMFLGFSFGSLLFFIVPMQGWYYWVIPFLAYFFARAGSRQALLLWALQASYLLYFALKPSSDYLNLFQVFWPNIAKSPGLYAFLAAKNIDASTFLNIAYTFLQTALLVNCVWIYRRGVTGYQDHKFAARSFLLGLSGDSGSGKTTLAASIKDLFTPRNVTIVCGDDMHKWQRGDQKWRELTHLDPRANELHRELNYISTLRQGISVRRRHYDHTTGLFTENVFIKPSPLIILEGLHSFYLDPTRELMDLKIFIKPDDSLLLHRKVLRDMRKRGYDKVKVLETIEKRRHDSEKFIKTQEKNADILVSFKLDKPIAEIGRIDVEVSPWLEITLSNAFFLDPLVEDIASFLGKDLRHYYDAETRQVLVIRRPLSREALEFLGEKHLQGLEDLGVYLPVWHDSFSGVLQLVIAWCIFAR
jgi:uridine kinase